jgi:hypothetical protein
VSGEAALSSAGRSTVGSNCSSLAILVRFANNVTTRNRISSFVEGSSKYINLRGALKKIVEEQHQESSTFTLKPCHMTNSGDCKITAISEDKQNSYHNYSLPVCDVMYFASQLLP